jgi:hypothetical protein
LDVRSGTAWVQFHWREVQVSFAGTLNMRSERPIGQLS